MSKKPPKEKSLAEVNPVLAKQWHPTKNCELSPFDVSAGSGTKVWWKCPHGDDHEWHLSPNQRSRGEACPICSGRKVVLSTCLGILEPELAKEWHPTKNNVTPFDVSPGTHKKAWWQCPKGDDHEWQAIIKDRTNNIGCPICSGHKVVLSNCLATLDPELAKEWHLTKNGNLTPFNVTTGTGRKVWWQCKAGVDHVWSAPVTSRSHGSGCSICSGQKIVHSNCLATLRPDLAKQWHPSKNGKLTPYDVTTGTAKKVWWKCPQGIDHEWISPVNNRSYGYGCPICSGRNVVDATSLLTLNPELAKEWHPSKNGELTPSDVTVSSHLKVWWTCDKGADHEWVDSIAHRSDGRGCSVCSGMRVVLSNCLATLHPELIKEWHPTKNGSLTPYDVVEFTNRKIWWICDKGEDHVYQSAVHSRSNGIGCPVCRGLKAVPSTSLATLRPELAEEWHPTKNGYLTPYDVVEFSAKKIWWICDKGEDHLWCTAISNRTSRDSGCPYCTLTPQSKQELTITFELKTIFTGIDPKGFKSRVNGKLWSIDIYIPGLNIGIEFDGNYWHKDKKALDKLKTVEFQDAGFNIIRIREEPLKKIFDTDVISKQPYDGKETSNNLLNQIMSTHKP